MALSSAHQRWCCCCCHRRRRAPVDADSNSPNSTRSAEATEWHRTTRKELVGFRCAPRPNRGKALSVRRCRGPILADDFPTVSICFDRRPLLGASLMPYSDQIVAILSPVYALSGDRRLGNSTNLSALDCLLAVADKKISDLKINKNSSTTSTRYNPMSHTYP